MGGASVAVGGAPDGSLEPTVTVSFAVASCDTFEQVPAFLQALTTAVFIVPGVTPFTVHV